MHPTRPFVAVAVAASSLLVGSLALAQAAPSKAEQALKYRKAVYQVIAWNFGPMGAMAQGKVPYDPREFALRAERVAAVVPMLAEAYPAETRGVANSRLKAEMWDNRADFDAKMQTLIDRSVALAAAATTSDFAQSKAAFMETGNACKACHDKYRSD
jgi:cytochrome c556